MLKDAFLKEIQSRSQTGMSQKDVSAIVAATFDTIQNIMAQGDSVSIQGFGTFSGEDVAARIGRNPKTKEQMEIPAHRAPKVKFSSRTREIVKG